MVLMLDVPLPNGWTRRLQVDFHREIGKIREVGESGTSGHPHVRIDGDDVLVENFFGKDNEVLDVSRYLIGEKNCIVRHADISGSELKRMLREQQIGSIVLLLESPHKDEYTDEKEVYDVNQPQAPANGKSGEKIDKYLATVLSDIRKEFNQAGLNEEQLIRDGYIEAELILPDCHVIISNPIPFQTSLHAVHGGPLKDDDDYRWATLRDFVWLKLWEEKHIRNSFQERLNTYNPSLIVNACTAGSKTHVTKFVRKEFPKVPLYNVGHPSFWHVPQNRVPKRIYPMTDANVDNQQ